MDEPKKRYSDEELEEFRALILEKIAKAQGEYDALRATVTADNSTTEGETSRKFDIIDDSSDVFQKAEAERMAQRQMQFIEKLRAALVRIDNKTYGICRVTGELIPKDRLKAVPHATLSIEAKNR